MIIPQETFITATYDNHETDDFREKSKQLHDYYQGDQKKYMEIIYQKIFGDDYEVDGAIQIRILNVIAKFAKALGQVYRDEPLRTILINGEPDDKLTKVYQQYTGQTIKQIILKEAERLSILQKTVLINPEWNEASGKLNYRVFLPFQIDVIEDSMNANDIEATLYKIQQPSQEFGNSDMETALVYWDIEHNYIVNADGNIMIKIQSPDNGEVFIDTEFTLAEVEDNPYLQDQLLNPYGIIPFVALRDSVNISNQFWGKQDETWISIQDFINQLLTEFGVSANYQAFSQWIHKGGGTRTNTYSGDAVEGEIKFSRLSVIGIGIGDELKAVSPDSHLKELQEAQEFLLKVFQWVKSIATLSPDKQVIQSGFAYKMSKFDTLEDIENRKLNCGYMEQQLFEVEKKIIEHHTGIKFPDNCILETRYADSDNLMNADEQIAKDTFALENNITTSAELLLRKRPDLRSITEAKKVIAENQEFNNNNQSEFSGSADIQTKEALENLTNNQKNEPDNE